MIKLLAIIQDALDDPPPRKAIFLLGMVWGVAIVALIARLCG